MPERVTDDKRYDTDVRDEGLAEIGVELIAPHRSNRKSENVAQEGRPLRRYRRGWTVERTISRIQHLRKLRIRWEKSTTLFQGFVHFGCTMLLLEEVLG